MVVRVETSRALAHPVRRLILRALEQGIASPRQLAAELNIRLGTVAYHVRVLDQLDLIELHHTRPVRGATEHFYTLATRPTLEQTRSSDGSVAELLADAADASHYIAPKLLHLRLDTQGVAELRELLSRMHGVATELAAAHPGEWAGELATLLVMSPDEP